MQCKNCNTEISPNPCLETAAHAALFSIVGQLVAATDVGEDVCIKIATALHGKFEIYPVGAVQDGYLVKEVQYVEVAVPVDYRTQSRPVARQRVADQDMLDDAVVNNFQSDQVNRNRTHAGRTEHYAAVRRKAEKVAGEDDLGSGAREALEHFRSTRPEFSELDVGGSPVRSQQDLIEMEAERRAQNKIAELQAQNAGIAKRRR
jgi:hypothetical protein